MRDIKFRAWCETEKHMYNWNNLLNQNLKNIFMIPEQCGYNLMQYTRLKDKNGKEIYEGDILSNNDDEIATVQYSEEDAMFEIIIDNILTNFSNENSKWWEVIGNIYDNPELLEAEE